MQHPEEQEKEKRKGLTPMGSNGVNLGCLVGKGKTKGSDPYAELCGHVGELVLG